MEDSAKRSTNAQPTEFLTPDEVRATFPGRWRSKKTLAASNVPGRVNVSPTRAVYQRDVFEKWAEEQRERQALLKDELRARAAHARAARAARRAPKPEELLADALAATIAAVDPEVER